MLQACGLCTAFLAFVCFLAVYNSFLYFLANVSILLPGGKWWRFMRRANCQPRPARKNSALYCLFMANSVRSFYFCFHRLQAFSPVALRPAVFCRPCRYSPALLSGEAKQRAGATAPVLPPARGYTATFISSALGGKISIFTPMPTSVPMKVPKIRLSPYCHAWLMVLR